MHGRFPRRKPSEGSRRRRKENGQSRETGTRPRRVVARVCDRRLYVRRAANSAESDGFRYVRRRCRRPLFGVFFFLFFLFVRRRDLFVYIDPHVSNANRVHTRVHVSRRSAAVSNATSDSLTSLCCRRPHDAFGFSTPLGWCLRVFRGPTSERYDADETQRKTPDTRSLTRGERGGLEKTQTGSRAAPAGRAETTRVCKPVVTTLTSRFRQKSDGRARRADIVFVRRDPHSRPVMEWGGRSSPGPGGQEVSTSFLFLLAVSNGNRRQNTDRMVCRENR